MHKPSWLTIKSMVLPVVTTALHLDCGVDAKVSNTVAS